MYSNKKHTINKKEWESCKRYFDYTCAYCGLPIEKYIVKFKGELIYGDFHKEHVNHEGKSDLSNCIPSCKSCNVQKHNKVLDDWYNKNNPNFTYERYNKIIKWVNEDWKKYYIEKKSKNL